MLRYFLNDLSLSPNCSSEACGNQVVNICFFSCSFGGVGEESSLWRHWQTCKGYWGPRLHRKWQRWPTARGTWTGCSTGDMICKRWWTVGACRPHRRQKPKGHRHRGPRGQLTPGERVTNSCYSAWVCTQQEPRPHPRWATQSHGHHRCTHHSLEKAVTCRRLPREMPSRPSSKCP